MSCLVRRPSAWYLSWSCEPGCRKHPPGGKAHFVSLRTKDGERARYLQKEFDKDLKERKALAALGLPQPVTTSDMTLVECRDWYEQKVLTEKLVKRNTYFRTERGALDSVIRACPHAKLSDLNLALMQIYQRAEKPRVADSTWNSRRGTLRMIFNRLIRWGVVAVNPFSLLDPAKVSKKRPKRLYQEQLPMVLKVASPFWQLVILFLYATGIRMGELCNLKREHVRWTQSYFEIETDKENEPKLLPLTPELITIMKAAEVMGTSAYVFSLKGQRLKEETVKSAFDRLSKKVGFPVSPHRMRHSHGTHTMEAGGNLKALQSVLGHADLKTTADFYLDVDLSGKRKSMTLLDIGPLLKDILSSLLFVYTMRIL